MALNMALGQVPQRVALRDLEQVVAQNNQDQQVLLLAVLAARRREQEEARARRPRRWWVKPWVAERPRHGQYFQLFEKLDVECNYDYMSYVKVDRNFFAEMLLRVGPRIQRSQRSVQHTFHYIVHICTYTYIKLLFIHCICVFSGVEHP
jgi:hypothetical protein